MTDTWTREGLEARGPTLDVPTLAAVLDASEWTIYEAIRRGRWDLTRVLRIGRKIKIPTRDVIALLYEPPPASLHEGTGHETRTAGSGVPAVALTYQTAARKSDDNDIDSTLPHAVVQPRG